MATASVSHSMMAEPGDIQSAVTMIQELLDKKDYEKAVSTLKMAISKDVTDATAWNLLGYTYRTSGQYEEAWEAYEQALTLEPGHLGANEYLGELYLLQGNMEGARAQLAKLEKLCPNGCDALDMLKASIAKKQ